MYGCCRVPRLRATDEKFNENRSSTYQVDGRTYFLPYGSGVAAGYLGRDVVTLGSTQVLNYTFGQTTVLPGDDFLPPFSGILGLAYPIISLPIGSFLPTVLDALIAQQLVPEPLVHVYLDSTNSSHNSVFSFGAVNPALARGPFTTVPFSLVQPIFGYWMVDVDKIEVPGEKVYDVQVWGVVDTGTSIITGPPLVMDPLIARMCVPRCEALPRALSPLGTTGTRRNLTFFFRTPAPTFPTPLPRPPPHSQQRDCRLLQPAHPPPHLL